MLRVTVRLAPGLAVPLTAGAGQHEIMGGHVLPARLVQILADMLGVRVIGCMPAHRLGPVVCCPYHLAPSHRRAGGEPARACEQVNRFHGLPPPILRAEYIRGTASWSWWRRCTSAESRTGGKGPFCLL